MLSPAPSLDWDALLTQTRARFLRVGVICGGVSSEREVSLRSGKNVQAALKRLGWDALLIDPGEALRFPEVDVLYNVLHGRWGEDGILQGYLELWQRPYTGPGLGGCALSWNKWVTRGLLQQAGLPVSKGGRVQTVHDLPPRFPVMVKPACEGSSVGVVYVPDQAHWDAVIAELLKNFSDLYWETYVKGREITIGVLGPASGPWAMPILEIKPKKLFYDYEAKYTPGLTDFEVPAHFSAGDTRRLQHLAVEVFRTLGCRGVGRVDMMVASDGEPYVLELNASPGMTDLSDLPAEAAAMGWTYDQLVLYILSLATLDLQR